MLNQNLNGFWWNTCTDLPIECLTPRSSPKGYALTC